jgi:hypothetical protein
VVSWELGYEKFTIHSSLLTTQTDTVKCNLK